MSAAGSGPLNAAIANEVGRLVAEFTGRGANKSRAFVHDDVRGVPARGRRHHRQSATSWSPGRETSCARSATPCSV